MEFSDIAIHGRIGEIPEAVRGKDHRESAECLRLGE
jgi:hypothetical protein